ncbi:M48 family metalloprotease [Thiomicrorhabdus sediminis]|uniref:Peptidase M48 n=1 Tax=Thiomicrorhabdus sediminis TaxID=2580412 RepID=A0A4P9K6D0_9GAMM|nr:M48 family metalloprotease [Thiomicrorhabdus sediminis]QCU90602.1 peptidase M48 [Thiomicrorhabdus sediminis]
MNFSRILRFSATAAVQNTKTVLAKALSIHAFAISTLMLSTASHATNLPDLGSPDLVEYDRITEKKLGQAFTYALHTEYKLYQDPAITQYIRDIGHQIAGFSGTNRHYSFYIIDNPAINAFAGPDGVIGIHTGLIKAVRNEDELAGVIAHEISHVTQNHLSRRYEYSTTQGTINSLASFIAAVLIGSQDPNAGMAVFMGGMGLNMQEQLKNSRQHESEADSLGIDLLYKAGYDPKAMASFFGHLNDQSRSNSQQVPEILRTHPTSAHRLAEASNRAQQLEFQPDPHKQSRLDIIKLKLQQTIESNPQHNVLRTAFDNCYKQALTGKTITDKTYDCLTDKTQNSGLLRQANYLLLQQADKLDDKQRKALQHYSEYMLALYPTDIALHNLYSNYLSENNQMLQATQLLENLDSKTYQYEIQQHIAKLYNRQNKTAKAYLNLAKAYIAVGDKERAKHYIEQANTLAKGNINLQNAIKNFIEDHAITLIEKNNS